MAKIIEFSPRLEWFPPAPKDRPAKVLQFPSKNERSPKVIYTPGGPIEVA